MSPIYISEVGMAHQKKNLSNAKVQKVPDNTDVACYGSTVKVRVLNEDRENSSTYISIVNQEDQDYLAKVGAKFPVPHSYATVGSSLSNSVIGRKPCNVSQIHFPDGNNKTIVIEEVKIIDYLISNKK